MNTDGRAPRQELWVGLFVILGALAALGTLFALTDPALFRGRYVVTTIVKDAAGVRRGDPVQLRGVNIGRVQRFKIKAEEVRIALEIEGEYEFPEDSTVVLEASSLLGGTVVQIEPGRSDAWAKGGQLLPGTTSPGIMEQAFALAKQAESTLERAQKLLSDENLENVRASTADLSKTLKQVSGLVEEQKRSLATLEASLQKSADKVQALTSKPELEGLPAQMSSAVTRLQAVSESLERSSQAMETVSAKVARGEGTLGKLAHDSSLYDGLNDATSHLNKATGELSGLIADIKKQPKRYFKFSVF